MGKSEVGRACRQMGESEGVGEGMGDDEAVGVRDDEADTSEGVDEGEETVSEGVLADGQACTW